MKPKKNLLGNSKIAVIGSGMMTGVGLTTQSTCAAIRCKLNNFVETKFLDNNEEPVVGSYVPLENALRGYRKLLHLVVSSIRECLDQLPDPDADSITLLVCLPESNRPGVIKGLHEKILGDIQAELSLTFSKASQTFAQDRVSGVYAIDKARELLTRGACRFCIIAGVDSFLTNGTISAFGPRLLKENNSDGFIPGEAGCSVILGRLTPGMKPVLEISGTGFGKETIHIESENSLSMKAEGMVQAVSNALGEAGQDLANIDYRMSDANGEQYVFKEAALTLTRVLKKRKEKFDIWHPADCLGEIGAAIVPCTLGFALTAAQKKYAPGNKLVCHYGNDDGTRGAVILEYKNLDK